jgi:hypothetical protein
MSLSGSRIGTSIFVVGFVVMTTHPPVHAQSFSLIGRGGHRDCGATPVLVEVKGSLADGHYVLTSGHSTDPVAAAVFSEGDRRWLGAILPAVPAEKSFSYDLKPRPAAGSSESSGVRFRASGSDLLVSIDDRPFSAYRVGPGSKPYLFPVIGPTGEAFTRAYPMADVPGEDRDHPHQRSLWFTHGSVNGIDFWSEGKGKGTIREIDRKVVVEGPVLGRLTTRNEWLAADGRPVCEDRRTFTFYGTRELRIIDFEVTIEATDGPLTFGDTKEGMFGLRVASSMDVTNKPGGKITNAEGLTDERAWGQASPWVDYVGPVKGQSVGIAVLNHPSSFRYPTTWHVRTYGLFAANPFGWKDFGRADRGDYVLPSGKKVRFAYRVILHKGATESLGLPGLFETYAGLPALEVRAE